MNPMDMMQLAGRLGIFRQQHPKFGLFLKKVASVGLREGDIMEVKFKSVDDREYTANIKLTADDIETINVIKNMKRNQ